MIVTSRTSSEQPSITASATSHLWELAGSEEPERVTLGAVAISGGRAAYKENQGLFYEDHPEVVVDDFAIGTECKVRGNQAGGIGELAFAALDAPHHRPMLEGGVGAQSEEALTNSCEIQQMIGLAEANRCRPH